jgi:hypothetical protein
MQKYNAFLQKSIFTRLAELALINIFVVIYFLLKGAEKKSKILVG